MLIVTLCSILLCSISLDMIFFYNNICTIQFWKYLLLYTFNSDYLYLERTLYIFLDQYIISFDIKRHNNKPLFHNKCTNIELKHLHCKYICKWI